MTESVEQAPAEGPPPRRKRHGLRVLVFIGVLIAAYIGWNIFDSYVLLGPATITISPETTYLTGPLNDDGTVNYTQAFIDRYSEGVTPENNAMTLLVQAFGADFVDEDIRPEVLRQLGLTEVDLAAGKKLTSWEKYVQSLGPDAEDEISAEVDVLWHCQRQPWTAQEYPELAAWLAEQAEPLALISQASHRPHSYFPLVSADDPPFVVTMHTPRVTSFRVARDALLARAMLRLSEDDIAGARADATAIYFLGQVRSPFLISHLINCGMAHVAFEIDTAIIASGKLSPDDARAMLADCLARPPLPDVIEALEDERMMFLDSVMMLYRAVRQAAPVQDDSGPDLSVIDWDYLLRCGAAFYTEWLVTAKLPYPERHLKESQTVDQMDRELAEGKTLLLVKACFHGITLNQRAARKMNTEVLARQLITMLTPEFANLHTRHEEIQTRGQLVLLALAAKVYHADHGDWPRELADLAPEYLPAIPADRFTTQPLVYERTDDGVRIYSLGPNMTDDAGLNYDTYTPADASAEDHDTPTIPKDADDIAIEVR